jgi:predicted phage terminase large subunit-like protein
VRLIDDTLQQVARGRIKRLIISMPPRHGKSALTSHVFPAWYLMLHPDHRIILASYEADFAASWGRKARDVVEHAGSWYGVKVRNDSSAANRWDLADHAGGMVTAGVGGPITGRGAHVLIVDDPIKNAEEANSETIRMKTWEWWTSTAYTRLEPDGAAIVIMTRWHEDDLAGKLIQSMQDGGEPWHVLELPAIAEEDEDIPLWAYPDKRYVRKAGDALWPSRYDIEDFERIKKAVGSRVWTALYMQRPTPADGQVFRRSDFRYYRIDQANRLYLLGDRRVPMDQTWRFGTMDLAIEAKSSADYTVLAIWDVTPDMDLILVDLIREQCSSAQHMEMLTGIFTRYPTITFVGIESVAYQKTLVKSAVKRGLRVKELRADRDKMSRGIMFSARYEVGSVWHPADADWLQAFERELLTFPNGKHDDQVDAGGYAALTVSYIAPARIRQL